MIINSKVYDALNIVAKLVAPIATFVSAVLAIWHVPYTEQITATLGAFDVLIGAVVVVLRATYNKKNKQ